MTTVVAPSAPAFTFPALRAGLDTPALVLDVERLEANLARLQSALDARGIALRPHAKTHKSIEIAKRQVAMGAIGLTVGTLGEAEVFGYAGIEGLFIAYPVSGRGPKADRLFVLTERMTPLMVGVDSVAGVEALGAAVYGAAVTLEVLIEIDPGNGRTGVAGPREAIVVARAAAAASLRVRGVFSHGGHSYRPGSAEAAGSDEVRALTEAADALEAAGFEVPVVSAGSTPTMLTAASGRVTEIRAGTYALGDRQQVILGSIPPGGCAVAVASTVVSAFDDRVVLDAGAKSLTKDRADYLAGHGAIVGYPDLVIERLSDYHAVVPTPSDAARPAIGDVVAIIPNHVCPVVDLFDEFVVVNPDGITERWPVDARGRSQ